MPDSATITWSRAMEHYPLYINGTPAPAADGGTFTSFEPATGDRFADIARGGLADVVQAVAAARTAFDAGPWPLLTGAERAAVLRRAAARLASEGDRLAELESRDGGGTIRKTRDADVPAAVAAFEWAAHWAEQLSGPVPAQPSAAAEYLRFVPYGVVAAIIPWNFPLLLAAARVAPAIAAGNTCVVKPASFTSVTALELARILGESGLPAGVVNVVTGPGASTGDALVRDRGVDLAAFTGSDLVGAGVAASAAGAGTCVRLDLGGKSANLVLADADLELAASGIAWSIFFHNGQICMAGARAIVHRSLYPDFIAMIRERAQRLRLGDPLERRTDLGPLVSRQQARMVHRHVQAGLAQGARLVCGGARPEPGELPGGLDRLAYYRPTVLADVDSTSTLAREEIFGPVLAVMPADSDEHAIALANDTSYGLAGAVWSADPERARRVAERVRAQQVWINDYRMVDLTRPGQVSQADPCWPWLTNGLNEYRTMRRVRRSPDGGRAARALYDLLAPGI
jgi:acyl-CoA reductase-like NAD-dependent aldehyde dehydrogenase